MRLTNEAKVFWLFVANCFGVAYVLLSYSYHRPLLGLPELLAILAWQLIIVLLGFIVM